MPIVKPANTGLALSRMIQTSAKSKGALIRHCPITDNPVVMVHFSSMKAAVQFHGAFSLFSTAAKRTVKNVRARQRAERQTSQAAHEATKRSYLYGRSP